MKDNDRERALAGHLGRGFFLSFFVHSSLVFPFIALAIMMAKKEAAEADLDVRFEDVSPAELPEDLPPLTPEDFTVPEPLPKKPPKLAQKDAKDLQAKPEKMEPAPEQQPQQPPPPKPDKAHQKMVDLDMGQEVEPPPDAKYLAQKNNRAKDETRARDTNLERAQQGTEGSSPSDRKDQNVGDDKTKIARDEDRKSLKGKQAPNVTPHTDPRMPQTQSSSPGKSLLTMRDAPKRDHEITPETADPSLERDPDGIKPIVDFRPEAVKDLPGKPGVNQSPRLALSGKQYEYLFGDDAEAAKELASKVRSKRQGRFSERMGKIQSALENFIPEVRPGNQTALNTRAAPFAAFIARMHRNIHELWGFGFLEDLDRKGMADPLNNLTLMTKLEIVLNGDGTVDKITVVKASGLTQFDVAAIDAVYSAAPYADPPREIRSGNGKIYVHWSFHRDERQCATSGVDYYILDNAPPGNDKGEPEPGQQGLALPAPKQGLKKLRREAAADNPAHRAKRAELDRAAGGGQAGGGEAAAEPDHDATRRAEQQVVHADDPVARQVAAIWFDGYVRGDLKAMVGQSLLPFRSSAGIAAKSAAELRNLLSSLLDESPQPRKVHGLQLYSPAGARGVLGSLPENFDEPGSLFAVAQANGDTFVLVLSKQKNAWKAVGLVRH
jgi:TonB family protein